MRTGMAAKMTLLLVPVLLRWPSWMRRDPRSGFAETCELAIGPPAPCIDRKTQFRLRTAEPENYTNGSVPDRGIHIVTQQSRNEAEIRFEHRREAKGTLSKRRQGWRGPKYCIKASACTIRLKIPNIRIEARRGPLLAADGAGERSKRSADTPKPGHHQPSYSTKDACDDSVDT